MFYWFFFFVKIFMFSPICRSIPNRKRQTTFSLMRHEIQLRMYRKVLYREVWRHIPSTSSNFFAQSEGHVFIISTLKSGFKGTSPHCKFFTEFFLFLDIWCPDMSQVKIWNKKGVLPSSFFRQPLLNDVTWPHFVSEWHPAFIVLSAANFARYMVKSCWNQF